MGRGVVVQAPQRRQVADQSAQPLAIDAVESDETQDEPAAAIVARDTCVDDEGLFARGAVNGDSHAATDAKRSSRSKASARVNTSFSA